MEGRVFNLGIKFILTFALACSISLSPLAQAQERNVFAPVPLKFRGRLVQRLQLFIEYENKDNKDNAASLYDMLFGPILEKIGKEEFVRKVLSSPNRKTVSFTPSSIDQKELEIIEGANWRIIGDLKEKRDDGSVEVKKGVLYAQLRNGEWYFSGFVYRRVETRRVEY